MDVICRQDRPLTKNQMTIQEVLAGGLHYEVSGTGYDPAGQILQSPAGGSGGAISLNECLRAGLLCNDAALAHKDGLWQVHGDPTEGAILVAALKGGLKQEDEHAAFPGSMRFLRVQHQYMSPARVREGRPR